MPTFRQLQRAVRSHTTRFDNNRPVPEAEICGAEVALGCALPMSLKWLLEECGYSELCGFDSLKSVVDLTIRCRRGFQLPIHFVVLADLGDSIICLETGHPGCNHECNVYRLSPRNLFQLADGRELRGDVDVYYNYASWVLSRLEAATERTAQVVEHC